MVANDTSSSDALVKSDAIGASSTAATNGITIKRDNEIKIS